MGTITVHRRGYVRRDGTVVQPTTYQMEDKGKPGKTPASEKFFNPKTRLNWHHDEAPAVRRAAALKAEHGDTLATARALQELANVTTDAATAHAAKEDADYFFASR